MSYHDPVMLNEAIEGLAIKEDGIYVDVTFGGGGHSRAILEKLTTGKLVAFDQDEDALRNVPDDERFIMIEQNFRHLKKYLKLYNLLPIDGLLADLGVSSHQFDTAGRGFSIRFEGDLDMRMDKEGELTAKQFLLKATKDELQSTFSKYGELRNSRTLAELIVHQRDGVKLDTTQDFIDLITPAIKGERNRYLAQVFQAIRISVNDEMGALEDLLTQCSEVIGENGRLVVMSNEPEKDFYGNFHRPFKSLTKKPITASEEELRRNPRSRSAKLRIAQRT